MISLVLSVSLYILESVINFFIMFYLYPLSLVCAIGNLLEMTMTEVFLKLEFCMIGFRRGCKKEFCNSLHFFLQSSKGSLL